MMYHSSYKYLLIEMTLSLKEFEDLNGTKDSKQSSRNDADPKHAPIVPMSHRVHCTWALQNRLAAPPHWPYGCGPARHLWRDHSREFAKHHGYCGVWAWLKFPAMQWIEFMTSSDTYCGTAASYHHSWHKNLVKLNHTRAFCTIAYR